MFYHYNNNIPKKWEKCHSNKFAKFLATSNCKQSWSSFLRLRSFLRLANISNASSTHPYLSKRRDAFLHVWQLNFSPLNSPNFKYPESSYCDAVDILQGWHSFHSIQSSNSCNNTSVPSNASCKSATFPRTTSASPHMFSFPAPELATQAIISQEWASLSNGARIASQATNQLKP